jgi:hypothetical protein
MPLAGLHFRFQRLYAFEIVPIPHVSFFPAPRWPCCRSLKRGQSRSRKRQVSRL